MYARVHGFVNKTEKLTEAGGIVTTLTRSAPVIDTLGKMEHRQVRKGGEIGKLVKSVSGETNMAEMAENVNTGRADNWRAWRIYIL